MALLVSSYDRALVQIWYMLSMYLFSKLEKTKKKGNKNSKLNDTKSEITQDKAGILAVCLEPTEA